MSEQYNELQAEIDEQKRKEKWRKIWNKFSIYIIGLSVIILFGAAIFTWQQSRAHKQALLYSDMYENARSSLNKGEIGVAVQQLQEIAKNAPINYKTMARFLLIEYYASMNNNEKITEIFQNIIQDKKTPIFYKELAQINFIRFQIDQENPTKEKLKTFLTTLSTLQNSQIKKLALEIEGFIYYQLKEFTKSRETYIQLAQIPDIDPEMRNRAQAMVRLIYMEEKNAKKA